MKTVGVCGHFAGKEETTSGQVIKTREVTNELIKMLGESEVTIVDSHGGVKALIRMFLQNFSMFYECRNIIIMPAYKGLRVFVPLFAFYNMFFKRRLHYVVIGGWLDSFLEHHKWLKDMLKAYTGIYVETAMMKKKLDKSGFENVVIMPNFKNLSIVTSSTKKFNKPFKLCTFSRVMREKGIEISIDAVKSINTKYGETIYTLDIYGQIDPHYQERFNMLRESFPKYIKYTGVVPFDKSVDVLQNYFALLFPTFYSGEGFAGTLIDAMAAGVPVVASDWKYNAEIVVQGKTGVLISDCSVSDLLDQLIIMKDQPDSWSSMRSTAIEEAQKFVPEIAIQCLLKRLQE